MISSPFANKVPTDIKENLRWRYNVNKKLRDNPGCIDYLIGACKQDPVFFINGFGWIYDPRGEPIKKMPFILYPFQVDALLELINAVNNHDILVEKSRDMGASYLCVAAITWHWLFRKRGSFLFVSRVESYVDDAGNPKSLFWKFDFLVDNLPKLMIPRGYSSQDKSVRRSMHALNPENGSVIDGESTNKQVARGDRRTAIVLDEFAVVEQDYSVLSSTRDATNCRIFNSTPSERGINCAFYTERQKDIKKLRLHWSEHPTKSIGLYKTNEQGKLELLGRGDLPFDYTPILDGKIRSPWYDLECERAGSPQEIARELDIDYSGSGYQYFNKEIITSIINEFSKKPLVSGDLSFDTITCNPIGFEENKKGRIKLWTFLTRGNLPTGKRYVLGCDISSGAGSSNSCISGWDADTNEKILEYANPYIRPEDFAKQTIAIAKWLRGDLTNEYKQKSATIGSGWHPSSCMIIWESNGPGQQFEGKLFETDWRDIYLRPTSKNKFANKKAMPGWYSTKDSKLVLIGDYRDAIQKKRAINRSKIALEECLEYVFDNRGGVVHSKSVGKADPSGAGASHGDRVLADALGVLGCKERIKPRQIDEEKTVIPYGSLAWRKKRVEDSKRKSVKELGDGW